MEYLFNTLPLSFIVILAFTLGVIIGSFLNVYIYRFHTGKSLSGHSHCLSCGHGLRFFELVPLVSYVCLRGKCLNCRSAIPSRYFWVELLTGLLFVMAVFTVLDLVSLIHLLIILSLLVVIAVYDFYHLVIPDELSGALLVIVMSEQLYFLIQGGSLIVFAYNLVAGLLGAMFLMFLWGVSKGKWLGFGDVKLVVPLGISIGFGSVFSMLVLSFWIGAFLSLLLLGYQKWQDRGQPHLRFLAKGLTMKSAVPFAPFLILGYLTVLFWQIDVLALITYA